jgi:hypothetical protein
MTAQLTFSDEERKYLAALLDSAFREKHAEVRRTEFSSSLHDQLRHEENLLRGLLERLRAAEAACNV